MVLDPRTIDASETEKQLSSTFRRNFVGYREDSARFMKLDLGKKMPALGDIFTHLLMAEAAIQKIRVKFLDMSLTMTIKISEQIKKDPEQSGKLMPIFSDLRRLFIKLDVEQAYEGRKASDMRGRVRRILSRIDAQERGIGGSALSLAGPVKEQRKTGTEG